MLEENERNMPYILTVLAAVVAISTCGSLAFGFLPSGNISQPFDDEGDSSSEMDQPIYEEVSNTTSNRTDAPLNTNITNDGLARDDIWVEEDESTNYKQPPFHPLYKCVDWMCKDPNNTWRKCACDNLCLLFGDCCYDAFDMSTYLASFTDHLSLLDMLVPDVKDPVFTYARFTECHDVYVSRGKVHSFQLVARCPDGETVDAAVKENCEDLPLRDFRNVIVSHKVTTETAIGFKNVYCARCHGFNSDELEFWNTTLSCNKASTEVANLASLMDHCDLFQAPPNPKVRRCEKQSYTVCENHEITEDYLLCKAYVAPLVINGHPYHNVHCAQCSGVYESKHTCVKSTSGSDMIHPENGKVFLNMLFNFDGNDMSWHCYGTTYKQSVADCAVHYVYDPIFKRCSLLDCPDIFIVENGRCQSRRPFQTHTPKLYSCDKCQLVIVGVQTTLSDSEFIGYLQSALDNININETFEIDRKYPQRNVDSDTLYTITFNSTLNFKISNIIRMVQVLLAHTAGNISDVIIQNYGNETDIYCDPDHILSYERSKIEINHKADYRVLLVKSEVILNLEDVMFKLDILDQGLNLTDLAVCKQRFFIHHCLNIQTYPEDAYYFMNDTIIFNNSGLSFGDESFVSYNSTLYVCVDGIGDVKIVANPYAVLANILTIVSMTSSALCLSVLIGITCRVKQLRNLHGKCLMCFSIALLAAYIGLLSPEFLPSILCKYTAIFQHFNWLSTFAWSCTMAFDLARRLSIWTLMTAGQTNENVIFKRYFAVAFGLPFLFVSICATVDTIFDEINVGYGEKGLCWITNPTASYFIFALPVSCALLFNIVCFIITLHGVEYAKRATKNLQKSRKEKSRCIMYTKVSFLLGFTWIVSYIAAILKIPWFDILSVCITGFQGVFVFIGFLQNSRVMKLLLQKHSKDSNRSNSKSLYTIKDTNVG